MKTTIKKALNTALTDGSIFANLPIYGELMTPQKMAIAYTLQHSGYKLSSAFLEQYLDSQGHITSEGLRDVPAVLRAVFEDAWDRKWDAITREYNPIHNYDRSELTAKSRMGDDTDTTTLGAGHVETVGNVKAYNSSQFTEAEKSVSDSNQKIDSTVHDYNSEDVTESHVEGNIGVTKTQEMIEDEFRMRAELNFYSKMFSDIDSYLALHVYGTQKEIRNLSFDMNISIEETADGAIITVGNQSVEIHNGKDGKDGTNGTNGTDGKNGLTPILDLRENGDLYVDYEEV